MNKKYKNQYGGNMGCLIWLVIFLVIILSACVKELPVCGRVIQMKRIYNNTSQWKYLRTEVVMDFGYQCGEFYSFVYQHRFDTTDLCLLEPVKLFWVIKN